MVTWPPRHADGQVVYSNGQSYWSMQMWPPPHAVGQVVYFNGQEYVVLNLNGMVNIFDKGLKYFYFKS